MVGARPRFLVTIALSGLVALSSLVSILPVSRAIAAQAHGINSSKMASPAIAPFDRLFIDMMVPHHQGAVVMAKIALKRATHQKIKMLARNIITSQNGEIARMKAWRKAWYGSAKTPSVAHMPMLPGMDMMGMHMDMMADVSHLKGAKPFDRAFIAAMIPHHQSAVVAAQLELKQGTHLRAKTLARAIIKAQQREIKQMQAWQKAWYGSSGAD